MKWLISELRIAPFVKKIGSTIRDTAGAVRPAKDQLVGFPIGVTIHAQCVGQTSSVDPVGLGTTWTLAFAIMPRALGLIG